MAESTGNYNSASGGLALAVAEGAGPYLQQLYWNEQAGQHPSAYVWAATGPKGAVEATPLYVVLARAGFKGPATPAAPPPGTPGATGYTPASWVTQVLTDAGLPVTPTTINNMLHWLPTEEPTTDWAHANNPLNINAGGSGYDTFPNLAVAAQQTAKYLLMPNYTQIANVLRNNGDIHAFSAAVVESPWAQSHYGVAPYDKMTGENGPVPGRTVDYLAGTGTGGGTVAGGGGTVATSSTMTAADWQALDAASKQPGGAQYLASANAAAQVAAQSTGAVAASPTGTLADVIASVLAPWGLDTPTIQQWVTRQITSFAAQNMSTAQIGEQIGIELQAPVGSSSDPLTTAAQQAFAAKYPGMALRAKNGLPPITVAQYQQLQDSYYQSASAVGITPAQLNALALAGGQPGNAVGVLVGNDVSAQELQSRLQNGYNAATQANPETLTLLQHYYPSVFPQGAHGQAPTNGALLSYYLDPKNTVSTLQNQITAAQIGTEGVNSEFGGIPVAQAQKLQQAGVTQQTARDTFKTLAKLTPLEQQLPGVPAEGTVMTQQQLVDYGFFGANQQELENVQSARKAPFTGGGGYATSAKGVVGAGGASTEGQQGT